MITTVAVLIPSTGRARQLEARVGRLLCQSPMRDDLYVMVVLSIPADDAESLKVAGRLYENRHPHYQLHIMERKPNTTAVDGWLAAYRYAVRYKADWFVLGADDVEWKQGWLRTALLEGGDAQVIGLNDGHTNLDDYAPHYMMRADYAEKYGFIPDGYRSWWFDREVCQQARARGVYAAAWGAFAMHYHPDWKTAQIDDTYRLGMEYREADRALYRERMGL